MLSAYLHVQPELGVVTALSSKFEVTSVQSGRCLRQCYVRGKACGPAAPGGDLEEGSSIRFWPDPDIYGAADWDLAAIAEVTQRYAILVPGLHIGLSMEATPSSPHRDFAEFLRNQAGASGLAFEPCRIDYATEDLQFRIALAWRRPKSPFFGKRWFFYNLQVAPEAGAYADAVQKGISSAFGHFAKTRKMGKSQNRTKCLTDNLLLVCVSIESAREHYVIEPTNEDPELTPLLSEAVESQLAPHLKSHAQAVEEFLNSLS